MNLDQHDPKTMVVQITMVIAENRIWFATQKKPKLPLFSLLMVCVVQSPFFLQQWHERYYQRYSSNNEVSGCTARV